MWAFPLRSPCRPTDWHLPLKQILLSASGLPQGASLVALQSVKDWSTGSAARDRCGAAAGDPHAGVVIFECCGVVR